MERDVAEQSVAQHPGDAYARERVPSPAWAGPVPQQDAASSPLTPPWMQPAGGVTSVTVGPAWAPSSPDPGDESVTRAVAEGAGAPPRRGWIKQVAVVSAVALLAGSLGAGIALAVDDGDTTVIYTTNGADPAARSAVLDGEILDVAGVVAKAGRSVVSVQTQLAGSVSRSAAGTGVVLTADGEILTNAHVVEGAASITVTLPGEVRARQANLVGADSAADLALLRIPNISGLTPADLGDSSALIVGDDVVAIGNALALRGGPTVTRGIVSALDRTLDAGAETMTGLLQTDASISSGNSGGPLVNAAGQVVGINTAVAASGGGTSAENVGFAIPINAAMPVVARLRSGGAAAARGSLGVRIADPTDGSRGTQIVSVEAGSPAEAAGLKVGDLVVSVGGRTVDGAAALSSAVRSHTPGEKVEIIVSRDGKEVRLTATLGQATDG